MRGSNCFTQVVLSLNPNPMGDQRSGSGGERGRAQRDYVTRGMKRVYDSSRLMLKRVSGESESVCLRSRIREQTTALRSESCQLIADTLSVIHMRHMRE